uniref:Uncharacterized protein n=1 Tax=Oryza nivara TaxID=4536 RepID=A0A0E0FQ73_ORYNI
MARRELLEVVLCVVVVEPLRGERVIVDVPGTNGIEAARAWNTCALPHPMDKRQSRSLGLGDSREFRTKRPAFVTLWIWHAEWTPEPSVGGFVRKNVVIHKQVGDESHVDLHL